jgi:hypothetical protein
MYDPRDPSCPSDPFDAELDSIQERVGRQFPDGAKRDRRFTEFADEEIEQQSLRDDFGELYTAYEVAYDKLRGAHREQDQPLGIIHFDEVHKVPGVDNIFDYMSKVSSLRSVPRQRLVDEFGVKVARAHRTLMLKAELSLLSDVHAILPADLAPYRVLVFTNPGRGTIDEREANIRERKIDLSAISPENLARLNFEDLIEIRRAAMEFFAVIDTCSNRLECFDLIWKSLTSYCEYINDQLAFRGAASESTRGVPNYIRLVQGKIARHPLVRDTVIGLTFKVVSAVTHSLTAQTGFQEVSAATDVPVQRAEQAVKSALTPKPLEGSLEHVKAKFVLSDMSQGERLMHYE